MDKLDGKKKLIFEATYADGRLIKERNRMFIAINKKNINDDLIYASGETTSMCEEHIKLCCKGKAWHEDFKVIEAIVSASHEMVKAGSDWEAI